MVLPIGILTDCAPGFIFLQILTNYFLFLVFFMMSIVVDVRCISLWLWFAFLWWLVMVSIFSCAWYPFICLFGKMSIQVLYLFLNSVACFCWFNFSDIKVVWVIYIVWIVTLDWTNHLQVTSPIQQVAFLFYW